MPYFLRPLDADGLRIKKPEPQAGQTTRTGMRAETTIRRPARDYRAGPADSKRLFVRSGAALYRSVAGRGLCVVAGFRALDQVRQEKIRALKLYVSRDAAKFPVVNSLGAALFGIAKLPSNFRGAAKLFDQLPVGVWGRVVGVHADY